ncbi:MAG: hypothetical protein LUQ11_05375 [Methylococcaceae bacterium]|nr:hypothetical protein [Methylococcaceae bacterium]
MNRDKLVNGIQFLKRSDFIGQVAFHEAGHAAAIYLRNRQKHLPQIYFHISLSGFNQQKRQSDAVRHESQGIFQAMLEGGLLQIQSLDMPDNEDCQSLECSTCHAAYEADVINLLAGPLAEARHVALRDGEQINHHLVNLDALKNYGGLSDMEKIEDYLNAYNCNPEKKMEKLKHLYVTSFEFIAQPAHWRAITRLAHFISTCGQELIRYEEAAEILDGNRKVAECLSCGR